MLHWLVVGHFDPIDPIDKSNKPYRPKPLRPISRESVERAVIEFGRDIEKYLRNDDGGCVYCNWSDAPGMLDSRVMKFAIFLAEREQAVIIEENNVVLWPPDARLLQQQSRGWVQNAKPGYSLHPAL